MSDDDVGWAACLDDLRDVQARLAALVGEGREGDLAVKMFGAVMAAILVQLWAEPDHPAFVPSVGYYTMYGSPNPDTLYRNTTIDPRGTYRISGQRGTVPDVTVMPFGAPTADGLQTFAPFDFDDLTIADDGTFDVVLSPERPAESQDWWRLDPEMRTLMLRSVSDHWGAHIEPRVAIVRLDTDPRRARTDPDALQRRFRSFAAVVEGMVMSGIRRVAQLRDDGIVNDLVTVDYSANGGLDDQWYQEGCFALDDDEALVIEARLPPELRAFSLSLTDEFFSTIDWTNAQSSLNRHQAQLDDDGVLRVVVASVDPGVANWLDTTGHRAGVLQFRWSGGACPEVSVKKVAATTIAVESGLPASTARVTPEQRAATIRARQAGVQLRSRW